MRIQSLPASLYLAAPLLLAACASQPDHTSSAAQAREDGWRIHCETEKSYRLDVKAIPGIYAGNWTWAETAAGESLQPEGELEAGYFILRGVTTESGASITPTRNTLRQYCLDTITREEPRELARVLAARDSSDLATPIVYPGESEEPGKVSRLVVFGDSLSDTGRLKHRMQVFPGSPYWLGRFTNGPAWPDYLDRSTSLSIQNRSYAGASINPPHDIDEAGLIGFVKDEGRFFVSGSIAEQVEEYLDKQLSPSRIDTPDNTAYLVWAGANDYISKEPISGLITTFLNTTRGELGYKSIAEETVNGILDQVRVLYAAGARRFLVVNMPDLGATPIVLQNESYRSALHLESDTGRRLELSRRLSVLTRYHNKILLEGVAALQQDFPDSNILLIDTYGLTKHILQRRHFDDDGKTFDYGFDLERFGQTLVYEDRQLTLQRNCYSGAYLGSLGEDAICNSPGTAFFWDVIHPSSLTHCWQAFFVGHTMAEAGWIEAMPAPEMFRTWCQGMVGST